MAYEEDALASAYAKGWLDGSLHAKFCRDPACPMCPTSPSEAEPQAPAPPAPRKRVPPPFRYFPPRPRESEDEDRPISDGTTSATRPPRDSGGG